MAEYNKNGYEYAKENMSNPNITIPSTLFPERKIKDEFMRSVGLYSKEDIKFAKYNGYGRFGRILDPYGRVNSGREYLFFVKPDLHICVEDGMPKDLMKKSRNSVYQIGKYNESNYSAVDENGHTLYLNPQLDSRPYFKNLIDTHPEVIKELQYGLNTNDPFSHLLSFSCSGYLDLPSSESDTIDNSATVFGTSYEYLKDSEKSDEQYSFQLQFTDNRTLDTYNFFKAYSEYHLARKSGLVTPPNDSYYRYKRLHNTMGIYKFIVSEDMETLLYWSYLWGVYPTSCPREAFSDPEFGDGLQFSVNFKSAFFEDMDPVILYNFNQLMFKVIGANNINIDNWLPVTYQNMSTDKYQTYNPFKFETDRINYNIKTNDLKNKNGYIENISSEHSVGADMINATIPIAALIDGRRYNDESNESRPRYRLRWYA